MPKWTDIAKLSDKDAKTREAQFETEMLALIAQGEPAKPASSVGAVSPAPAGSRERDNRDSEPQHSSAPVGAVYNRDSASPPNGIQISVTTNGQTAHYNNLESVPGPVRQQIMSAWIASPAASAPPVLNAPVFRTALPPPSPSASRPKTMKMAMFLNLMIPGTGQIYLGQRLAGTVYALAFLASFAAVFAIFVHGYLNYLNLSTSGDILDSGNLEQVAHAFPAGMIGTLSALGIVIYLVSTIHLAVSKARSAK